MRNKNGRYEYENPCAAYIILGILIGMCIFMIFDCCNMGVVSHISQDTKNTICQKLNPDGKVSIGHIESGKLVCEYPSYDNTQDIIFKPNNEDDK